MNVYVKAHVSGNTALKHSTIANVIDVSNLKVKVEKPAPSIYTSQGKLKARPCDAIRSEEDIQRVAHHLLTTGEESQRLRNYMLFVVGISVGLRACDLLRIKIKDVLHVNGYIVDELLIFESKTSKMNHPILNDEAKTAIAQYLNSLPSYSPEDYLFKARGKAKMEEHSVYGIMRKVQKELDLPYHLGAHSLRKTFAYWTIKLHYDDQNVIFSLQEMLNHDSVKTTLHYSGHTKEHLRTMYNDIGTVLNGTAKETPSTTSSMEAKMDMLLEMLGANS